MRVLFPSKRARIEISFSVLATLLSTMAEAGVGVWTTAGPTQGGGVVIADQRNSGVLYASANSGSFEPTAQPHKSTDSGATWSALGDRNCQSQSVIPLATAPPSTIYFARSGSRGIGSSYFTAVVASTDGGASCSGALFPEDSVLGTSLAVDATNPMELFVTQGGYYGSFPSVSRSLDGGATWARIESGLSLRTPDSGILVTDPKISGTLYLAMSQTLFKSVDAGAVWSSLVDASGQIATLAVDPANSSVVYMGGTPNLLQGGAASVVKSVDGGRTFTGAGAGLPGSPVSALCVNPRNSMQVFAATHEGVFVSLDAGASWAAMNSGLTDPYVESLAIDPLGEYLHAGTGSGVFDFQLAAPTCARDAHTLCLNGGRFAVSASFSTGLGALPVQATAVALTSDTGYFWFFDPANVEMVVKVLTGCPVNDDYWVFAGGLTNVGVQWNVTDTLIGASKTYSNDLETPFQPVQDSSAFPCP